MSGYSSAAQRRKAEGHGIWTKLWARALTCFVSLDLMALKGRMTLKGSLRWSGQKGRRAVRNPW